MLASTSATPPAPEPASRRARTTKAPASAPVVVQPPPPIPLAKPPVPDELADLFANTVADKAPDALPSSGVTQDDLDRLFGEA